MTAPRLEVDLKKIKHNVEILYKLFDSKGISITAVTKGLLGCPSVAKVLVENGIHSVGESHLTNIKKMKEVGVEAEFMMIRTPMISEAEELVKYADISLNSEISVIRLLSEYALKQKKRHKVILMVELGDLREGIMPSDLERTVEETLKLDGITLSGIGANLTCFGGVKPTEVNMGLLSSSANQIQLKYGIKLEYVSGGNSANYEWFTSAKDVGLINNLRIGEAILLGRETVGRKRIPGLYTDAFTLIAEVIELKTKPSLPYGERCQDAFGNKPKFKNIGYIKRAILAIGRQDVYFTKIKPRIDADIIGGSSDHLILNAERCYLELGSEVEFDVNYGSLLRAIISPYVEKIYLK